VGGGSGALGGSRSAGGGPGGGGLLEGGASGVAAGAGALAPGTPATARGGRSATRGRSAARPPRSARERAARKRTVDRKRGRLVRLLSGCLARLPRKQQATLILRYGIGPIRPRSGRETAQLLDVSRRRVRLLERRGVRSLAGIGQDSACAGTGIGRTTLVAVYDLLLDTSAPGGRALPPLLETGVQLANTASVALEDEQAAAVAGVRESGGDRREASLEPEEDGPVASAGPLLGAPFGDAGASLDNPFFLLLIAIAVACLASTAREIRRAVR
jgi:hypothetical protein